MSELTRREALHRLALTIAAAGLVDPIAAQEAHHAVRQSAAASGGSYLPKALTATEFRTLERLTNLIIPAESGKPGAVQCDVAAWIDMLLNVNAELKNRYTAGLAWIDQTMKARGGTDFVSAPPAEQTALLDLIAFQKNRSPELTPGIDFFILLRRMTADGFYTSPIGMRDVYLGNSPSTEFVVPKASVDHVLSKSPLK
jgi:Gluconate 2-dehydrogenase subunit 3